MREIFLICMAVFCVVGAKPDNFGSLGHADNWSDDIKDKFLQWYLIFLPSALQLNPNDPNEGQTLDATDLIWANALGYLPNSSERTFRILFLEWIEFTRSDLMDVIFADNQIAARVQQIHQMHQTHRDYDMPDPNQILIKSVCSLQHQSETGASGTSNQNHLNNQQSEEGGGGWWSRLSRSYTHDVLKNTCVICGKVLSHNSNFKRHMATHSRENVHRCKLCRRYFYEKCEYDAHLKKHTDVVRYKCEVCAEGFYHKCDLKKHAVKHERNKPFQCPVCGRSFSWTTSRNHHMKTQHRARLPHESSQNAELLGRPDNPSLMGTDEEANSDTCQNNIFKGKGKALIKKPISDGGDTITPRRYPHCAPSDVRASTQSSSSSGFNGVQSSSRCAASRAQSTPSSSSGGAQASSGGAARGAQSSCSSSSGGAQASSGTSFSGAQASSSIACTSIFSSPGNSSVAEQPSPPPHERDHKQ